MKFKARLRALERRFGIKTGLPMPDIISLYMEPLLDAEGKNVWGSQRCDSVRARVDYGENTTYCNRNEGETLEDFARRVLASHPHGRFSRLLTFIPVEHPPAT